MRVLLTDHLPLTLLAGATLGLAGGLHDQGHQVQCLVVDSHGDDESPSLPISVRRVVCRQGDAGADLPFDVPAFIGNPNSRQTFRGLDEDQLAEYRAALRRRLDRCVLEFDPHIVHCRQAWLFGHLALESGVPYVLTAEGPELQALLDDPRQRGHVEQAVENAGRIIAESPGLATELAAAFPAMSHLIALAPAGCESARFHAAIYEDVLNQRFGPEGWS